MINEIFSVIFAPLLSLQFSVFILSISFIIAIINTLFYKLFVDVDELKRIREKMKELQEKYKKTEKTSKEAEKITTEMLELTHKQMKMSFKPMIASLILVVLFLPWIAHISVKKIDLSPGSESVTFKYFTTQPVYLTLKPIENGKFLVSTKKTSKVVENDNVFCLGENFYRIKQINENTLELSNVVRLPFSLPFVGNSLGWLGWYILCSLIFIYLLRKVFGIAI